MPVVVQNELNMFRRLTWPYTEENEVDTVVIDLCGNEHWSYQNRADALTFKVAVTFKWQQTSVHCKVSSVTPRHLDSNTTPSCIINEMIFVSGTECIEVVRVSK